ncbi:hypothetical protein F4776DRAFT_673170 [Hypoxylon sp. NC0597]|nr:hypothetical protein F4776DRAFT_673170 [Hypoxylon sp. NC0597]
MLQASHSKVSWIGTVQIFVLLFLRTLSGRASDAGLVHEAVLEGTLLIVFGVFMISLATQYFQLFLAQGVCIGLEMGILYMPGLSGPWSYFKAKKPLAAAIIVSGAGLVYPAMGQHLLSRVDEYRWSSERLILSDIGFGWIVCSIAFVTLFVFYYLPIRLFTSLDSINILLVTNALGIPGRTLLGFARLILLATVTHAPDPLYGFAIAYGLVASAIQSLFIVFLAALTEDLGQLATRLGMVFSVVAFASLTGRLIAGAIIQTSGGSYLRAQLWAVSSLLLGAVAMAVARVSRTR